MSVYTVRLHLTVCASSLGEARGLAINLGEQLADADMPELLTCCVDNEDEITAADDEE